MARDQGFGPGILHSEDLQTGEASHFLTETDLLRTERLKEEWGVWGKLALPLPSDPTLLYTHLVFI